MLITSDEYPSYEVAIREVYGRKLVPAPTGKRGRPAGPQTIMPPDLCYATVRKERNYPEVLQIPKIGETVHKSRFYAQNFGIIITSF